MNTHEPTEPTLPMTCERMELLLPLLDDGDMEPPTRAAALEHLHGCAHCQRERERDLALDQALRARFGFSSAPTHTTEEVMQHITRRGQAPGNIPTEPANPRRFARFTRFNHPWLSGLGAVAVVVVLLGMATLLFGGRFGFGPGAQYGGPPRYTFPGTKGVIADVSMVSPTEGWALAKGPLPDTMTFYHYQSATWTPVRVHLSASAASTLQQGGPGGFNGAISMDSATDGWAVASNFNRGSVLFHFTHGTWQEAPEPEQDLSSIQALSPRSVWGITGYSNAGAQPTAIVHYDGATWATQTIPDVAPDAQVVQLQMISDSQGWALIFNHNGPYQVARYAGNNTWTIHSAIDAGDLGDISGLAMVSPDDGWAIGSRPVNGPDSVTAGKPVPQALYHYSQGKWQTAPMSFSDSFSFLTLEKIVMRSAHDGWIIAQDQNQRPGITASGIQKRTILLHYDGSEWKEAQAPVTGGDASVITNMAFAGDSGWACGYIAALPDGKTIQDSDVPSFGSPMLWHYANGAWSLYQQQ